MRIPYAGVEPYTTRDGTVIRELMHPDVHGNSGASLAEAELAPGLASHAHRHDATEEIYHFTSGAGTMLLGDDTFDVAPGDTVLIPPGTAHGLVNTGSKPMRLLCVCTPAYSHEDTILV
ncbi:MAG: cupin domain-containing protein [Desulfatibacillaceae bacterium]